MLTSKLLRLHVVRRCLSTTIRSKPSEQQSRRTREPAREQTQPDRDAGYKASRYGKVNAAFSEFQYVDGQQPAPQSQRNRSRRKSDFTVEDSSTISPRPEADASLEPEDSFGDVSSKFSQQEPASRKTPKKEELYHYLEDHEAIFKNSVLGLRHRKGRMKNRKVLLEGSRLIMDAIDCAVPISKVFASRKDVMDAIISEKLDAMDPELYMVSAKQMRMWSELVTPPGIMAIADMPEIPAARKAMPLTVILDNIRDPGNMGAIVRVLAAAGCSQLITIEECVDPWDGKVVRAGMGGHFRIPLHYNLRWDEAINYIDDEASVFLADNLEEKGIDPLARVVDERHSTRIDRRRSRLALETVSYHDADFTGKSVVLIIGGETHGVSEEAYRLTKEKEGTKVMIPMSLGMDSLNAASAVAVLAFEMKRQRVGLEEENGEEEEQYKETETPELSLEPKPISYI